MRRQGKSLAHCFHWLMDERAWQRAERRAANTLGIPCPPPREVTYDSAPPAWSENYRACEDAWEASSAQVMLERLRAGAAFAEACYLQVQEIRRLPERAA